MKSFTEWQEQRAIKEFVGPAGQTDPMGSASPKAQQAPAPQMELPIGIQRFLSVLATKPVPYIVGMRTALDGAIQNMLNGKSNSAGRRGAFTAYANARSARQNLAQQN